MSAKKNQGGRYRPDGPLPFLLAAWFILLGLAAMGASFAFAAYSGMERQSRTRNVSKPLCSVSGPCDIAISVSFDADPVDVLVVSPSGEKQLLSGLPDYALMNGTASASLSTDEAGDWSVEYQPMSNRDIKIASDLLPPSVPFLYDVETDISPGRASLSFRTAYGGQDLYDCVVRIKDGDRVYTVYSDPVRMDGETSVDLSMSGVPSLSGAELALFLVPSVGRDPASWLAPDGMSLADPADRSAMSYSVSPFGYEMGG